jgi:hypothetical protein
MANLARAYGPDEPDYSAAAIIEPNPDDRPFKLPAGSSALGHHGQDRSHFG